jgi:PhnB protein
LGNPVSAAVLSPRQATELIYLLQLAATEPPFHPRSQSMQVNTHLSFNGQCAEAFRLYENVLGAQIQMAMTYGESPMAEMVPPDWRDKVMHTTLTLGSDTIMGADAPPGRYQQPQGFSVALNIDDPQEAERAFRTLAEGGKELMPLQETFWAVRFGMLVDRFGIPWMINCGKAN